MIKGVGVCEMWAQHKRKKLCSVNHRFASGVCQNAYMAFTPDSRSGIVSPQRRSVERATGAATATTT